MSRRWWREQRYFAPSRPRKPRAESRHSRRAASSAELVGEALDPGLESFNIGPAITWPILCAERPGPVDRDRQGPGQGEGAGLAAEAV